MFFPRINESTCVASRHTEQPNVTQLHARPLHAARQHKTLSFGTQQYITPSPATPPHATVPHAKQRYATLPQSKERITARGRLAVMLLLMLVLQAACNRQPPLGENEAIRTYVEFADGKNRGMFDPETGRKGYPDEDFDATTAMVVNWHRMPENDPRANALLKYRQVHPKTSGWMHAHGESYEFWYREELINRVMLTGLVPGSVYEFSVKEHGNSYRFRTLPASLDERDVTIVFTADHQSPDWSEVAHKNAQLAAKMKPDMFAVAGDFLNDEGRITEENAERWARYFDILFGTDNGYFLYDTEIEGVLFENIIIPHVAVIGNHEMGDTHHLRWPACVNTGRSEPGYPQYNAANWMELLFHWPFRSEGFYSELHPGHPNMNPEHVREGFGHGGFGALHFADYLLLIGLDNSQNWEGLPNTGLKDWQGIPITENWPWFEEHHGDVRQDLWLQNLLEPENGPTAGEKFTHIIPFWHRGLFGTVRLNMSLKNRSILEYWLPVLHRNGVKLIKEGHDHVYTRTVPFRIVKEQPAGTELGRMYYKPNSWTLTDNLSQEYLDDFYSVHVLTDRESGEIVGWEYSGEFITFDPAGTRAIGHGGWAAGRRGIGGRGAGNAGWWYVDPEKGGDTFGGDQAFHINKVILSNDELVVEAWHPGQLESVRQGGGQPFHRFKWDIPGSRWLTFDFQKDEWVPDAP